jgi:hypothetical protein
VARGRRSRAIAAAAMGHILRPGVSFCRTSGRHLFLDVRRDRYFALDESAEQAFAAVVSGRSAPDPALAPLVADGLLIETPGEDRPMPCEAPPLPRASLCDEARAGRRGALAALLARTAATAELRVLSLGGALARLSRRKRRKPGTLSDPACALAAARAFAAAALILPARDRCLTTSLALAHRLVSIGMAPQLVLGVRLHPFQAHCWVQLGAALPGDRVDTVRSFTPILVV